MKDLLLSRMASLGLRQFTPALSGPSCCFAVVVAGLQTGSLFCVVSASALCFRLLLLNSPLIYPEGIRGATRLPRGDSRGHSPLLYEGPQ